MKPPVILSGADSGNFRLSSILSEKICVYSDFSLIIYGLGKVKRIVMHGNSFSYKVGDQVMEE